MRALCIAILLAASTATADPKLSANLEVPTVTRGLDKVPEGRPTVLVTTKGIIIEGKAIVSISEGAVDPSEKEGGALGIAIPRLTKLVQNLSKIHAPGGFVLAFDKSLPYQLLVEVMFSIKKAGIRDFALLAHAKELGVIPITLPDKAPASAMKPASPADAPVKLAVAIAKDQLLLWSLSGLEGTLTKPKLAVARTEAAKLTPALAEIAKRRFASKRADADRGIIVLADSMIPMQDIANVLVAIRSDATGTPLFPDVLLSTGFE